MFPAENNFLKLLAYANDNKQKKNIIKFTNKSQLHVLKDIAKKLINGNIYLKKQQFTHLKKDKLFLRKLAEGKIKTKDLSCKYLTVSYIVKIALEHYETHSKVSSRAYRKVGKIRRQYVRERSFSENTSSTESTTSEESCFSSEEYETSAGDGENTENNSDVSISITEEEKD